MLARMRDPLNRSNVLVLAALGLASGLCSALVGIDRALDGWRPVAALFGMHPGLLPVGCFFALAMALGATWAHRGALAAGAIGIATLYAWSGAVHIAIRLQRNVGDDAHLIAAGLGAGAFGAAVVAAAFAMFTPALRTLQSVAFVAAVGAIAGLLFSAGERGFVDRWVLFVVWQLAVAAAIGWRLDRAARR